MVVGGVTATSAAIYGANPRYNNPTYNIYDPDTRYVQAAGCNRGRAECGLLAAQHVCPAMRRAAAAACGSAPPCYPPLAPTTPPSPPQAQDVWRGSARHERAAAAHFPRLKLPCCDGTAHRKIGCALGQHNGASSLLRCMQPGCRAGGVRCAISCCRCCCRCRCCCQPAALQLTARYCSAAAVQYLYKKCGHWRYCKDGRLPDRPHPPWSSPQTGG